MVLDALGDVRWFAVLAAGAAAFVVGAVWFAPQALGTAWARSVADYSGSEADEVTRRAGEPGVLGRWFVSVLVIATVVELALQAGGADGVGDAVGLAVVLSAGLGGAFFSWPVVFARLPLRWWLLNSAALAVMAAAMGVVLGLWP